ncbi:MAG: bifunctional folylpolyglutamate synthase/dihydrofolate synthase [Proteobacteria bacterium]|nr:bifunctional folylpolyglutamate synthase/dihydrofolate synthase [Pseudomonadota bacterium]
MGLERIKKVYDSLKLDKISPTIITVAGTNGKGSTVAILSSITQQSQYKVGCFTSPHILSFNERIQINSENVADREIIQAFELIEENLNGVTLSYFEYATLAAFIVFKKQQVDISILEVGLGGRLDSVNVLDTDCAIITTIDIDHTEWLGDDIESIAFEKAGIIRANKPVIYGDTDCPKSIISHAKNIGANLTVVDSSIKIPKMNIKGKFQTKNARTAITALSLMSEINISQENINKGLLNIQLSGRLQTIATQPEIIVDVSHNRQAALSLANWLRENPVTGKTIAVFAVLKDKHAVKWLEDFRGLIDCWCISDLESERTMPKNELLQLLADSYKLVMSFVSVQQAFTKAKTIADSNDRIVVFGSFYTVSEVM